MANKKNIRKWVEALRSKSYRQVRGTLSETREDGRTGYCCLGVACEVAIKNGVKVEKVTGEDSGITSYDNETGRLPYSVMNWLGIDYRDPYIFDSEEEDYTASKLNDELGFGFKRIATLIEKEFL